MVNSSMMCFAPAYLSMMNKTKRISTFIVLCKLSSKITSPAIASMLPSNANPINAPFQFRTGEPEFPPVMSLSVKKFTCNEPSLSAY